jgi:tetratricopeptide (TPR) repeat protein
VQAKKGLTLSEAEGSPLADAIGQAVWMFRSGAPAGPEQPMRDWNPDTDRLVIATDGKASRAVREDLAAVVARLASAPSWASVDQLTNSEKERRALKIFTAHVGRLWKGVDGTAMSRADFRAFCAVVRVMSFDFQSTGRELVNAKYVLATVLRDRGQADAAWATLLRECADLSADRMFASAVDLRGALAASHIATRPTEHSISETGPAYIPETVLGGPLASSAQQQRMTEAKELLETDPRAAAATYRSVMDDLERQGYHHVAVQVQPDLTRALRASRQHRAAVRTVVAAAWWSVWNGEVPTALPEAMILENELRKSSEEPARSGQAVVAVLKYEAGDWPLENVAERVADLAEGDEHEGELLLWLAEETVASRCPETFAPFCDRALAAADEASADSAEVAGRLRIAVAESRHDWAGLLATIEADRGAAMYVLALARRGQALAWRNELTEAIASYEEAITRGLQQQMFAEVRTWLYDLRTLRTSAGGPGSLGHDPHFTALSLPPTYRLSVFANEERLLARGLTALEDGKLERAHCTFMRLRHRMAAGAALIDQRQCEGHRGAILTGLNRPDEAIGCYLRAGDDKRAIDLVRTEPDAPLVPRPQWVTGPVWEVRAAYELLGFHGDLVPERAARELFNDLSNRLVTSGNIHGWSNFQANETLFKPLAELVWASSVDSATRLLERLAPLAERGGVVRVVHEHMHFLLGCARVHTKLITAAAQQVVDLISASERAVPHDLDTALKRLAPARDYLVERLSTVYADGRAPWLAAVLVELGVRTGPVVNYANEALDRAATPRSYTEHASLGSDVVHVAHHSSAGEADHCDRFIDAMLILAADSRESHAGHREAIDAIAVVAQRRGVESLGEEMIAKIRHTATPLARGEGIASAHDAFADLWGGSPGALMAAASRLLLILSSDDNERSLLIRPLLLTLMDDEVSEARLLRSALAQVPAHLFQYDLLFLAGSRVSEIRALAARRWAELGPAHHDIGRRLAKDRSGLVRANLAYGLKENDDPDQSGIRTQLVQDCRFTVRAAAKGHG